MNHAVLGIGYNKTAEIPYYTIKNSWGPDWGEEGYVRLEISAEDMGTCWMNFEPSYPTLD